MHLFIFFLLGFRDDGDALVRSTELREPTGEQDQRNTVRSAAVTRSTVLRTVATVLARVYQSETSGQIVTATRCGQRNSQKQLVLIAKSIRSGPVPGSVCRMGTKPVLRRLGLVSFRCCEIRLRR
jgi:hypothetical protein